MADSHDHTAEGKRIGLLCGGGSLPIRVADDLRASGASVVGVAIKGEADPAIEDHLDTVQWTGLAKLGRWVRIFRGAEVDVLLMVGSIRKERLFASKLGMLPDLRTIKLWYNGIRTHEDHTILGAVADEFEKEGIAVGSVPDYCPDLLMRPGCLTNREPTESQWLDIQFAWPIIKQIAALQIGQCLVVKDRAVVAVEGIDGTDATLRRGGRLAGPGAVAVKVAREGHDERFDIPCIGPDTVTSLAEAGISVLAAEARRTILLDPDTVRGRADEEDVCIVAVNDGQVTAEPDPPAPVSGEG